MPNHIGIIMDGNRRYAKEFLGDDIDEGHRAGERKIRELLDWCLDLKIRYITVYAFSSENFSRGEDEVSFLMGMAADSIREIADDERIVKNHVRIRVLGNRELLPESVRESIEYCESKTAAFSDFTFSICLAYGGRQEIISAVQSIARKVQAGEISPEDIDEDMLSQHLYTSDIPDPDLILRTSGEIRISNFLLWQLAYSELYFTDIYWPGFRRIDLMRAIRSYQARVRRYGR
ncbi:polyprenyl diphosphate synthase [Methanomassiliicoccales archaeon LGM-DZ1]|nr:polyprenyl diphosphate synthase [Methanomassiliicoccales archaeon LGM-DZ1]